MRGGRRSPFGVSDGCLAVGGASISKSENKNGCLTVDIEHAPWFSTTRIMLLCLALSYPGRLGEKITAYPRGNAVFDALRTVLNTHGARISTASICETRGSSRCC